MMKALKAKKTRLIPTILPFIIAFLAALPILLVLGSLFISGSNNTLHVWTITLPHYIFNTLILMASVSLLSIFIGVSTAWAITAFHFPGRKILSWLLVLPLAAPAYIIAYLYTDILDYSGPIQSFIRETFNWSQSDYVFPSIRSLGGATFILGFVLYPYVYVLSRAAFKTQSVNQFQAARSLGLSPSQAFYKTVLPSARPAIAGGTALVLMETLADFGVVDYFSIPTFSTGIFRTWFGLGDPLAAIKLAGVMMLFVIMLVSLEAISRQGSFESNSHGHEFITPIKLSKFKQYGLTFFCFCPVFIGFIIPCITLLNLTIQSGDRIEPSILLDYIGNSFYLAFITAIIVSLLALFLIYVSRTSNPNGQGKAKKKLLQLLQSSIRISTLGYALPGAMLAIGILLPLGWFDQILTRNINDLFGTKYGLLLSGSIALLTYALTIRFLTASFNSLSSSMSRIPVSMDETARTLGASPSRLFWQIHFPLLRPGLTAGACLVFIDVMRELPATLILRPFNFETLATRVYRLASDERLSEASTAALIIVLAGVIPVIFLNRLPKQG